MADNSQQQPPAEPRQRGRGRPFAKGQSGNPGGRPREAAEVKALAREFGPEAIRKLAKLMRDADKEETQRAAAIDLLDRGYGRPTQAIEGEIRSAIVFRIEDE